MKKILYILSVGLMISMLAACDSSVEEKEVVQLANTETEKVVVKSNGKYVTGDFLIEVSTNYEKGPSIGTDSSQFFFGGFIVTGDDENGSFVINEFLNRSNNSAKSSNYYYKLNKTIKLPRSDVYLKVVNYDINKDTIELELVNGNEK